MHFKKKLHKNYQKKLPQYHLPVRIKLYQYKYQDGKRKQRGPSITH
jgi:hypothetical protein